MPRRAAASSSQTKIRLGIPFITATFRAFARSYPPFHPESRHPLIDLPRRCDPEFFRPSRH